jgi:hypothetical protein
MRRYCGKTVKEGKWVKGDLQHNEINDTWIVNMHSCIGEGSFDNVKPASVGQGTGEFDKTKNEMFEGDLVELDNFKPKIYVIEFIEGAFCFTRPDLEDLPIDLNHSSNSNGSIATIIGKAYDNKNWWKV